VSTLFLPRPFQCLLGLAILLAVPNVSWGQFQTPPPAAPQRTRQQAIPPPPPTQNTQQQNNDERGTEKSPLVVRTLKSSEDIAKDNQDRSDKAFNNRAIMFVGAAVAILAFLQLSTFVALIRTSRSQLRAYVQVHSAKIYNALDDKGGPVAAHIVIKNFGQTPAHKVMNASGLAFEKHPPPSALNLLTTDKEFSAANRSKNELAPGQTEEIVEIARRPGLSEQERRDLVDGQMAIFVYGEIRFTDVFGRGQRTRYRYMLGGSLGVRSGGTLVACEDGNEAS
jgi:hypothetical protein